jgi:hypothetical protein
MSRIVAVIVAALTLTLAGATAAQADVAPRRTCVDTVTTVNRGRVEITTQTRVCPGIYYVKVWMTVPSGKTRLIVDTFPAPAPRR